MTRFTLQAAALLALTAAAPAAADDLLDRLNAIPGLTVVQERPNPFGGRFFVLTYEQPVNHLKPWKGTFRQRVTLYHQDLAAPMVFYSGGYNIGTNLSRTEVTQIVGGNQLVIEHRFFPPSRPEPADWSDLTIFQQASDDHRLVQAFRSMYPGRWLRSGSSKGGMQATYHTRFYPSDTYGLVAYVTPNDAIDSHDRYEHFLDNVGDDPQCRANLKAVQREALLRRDEIIPMVVDQLGPNAFDQVVGSPERALELLVTELPFTFWQVGLPSDCAFIPPATASTSEIFFFIDSWPGFFFFADDVIGSFEPYYFQAGTQLGYPHVADAHLADLLLFPGGDVPRSFVRPEIEAEMGPFQWWAMPDIDLFVRFLGRRQMFIYGENDPWGAEPFQPTAFAADSRSYVAPGANHGARVASLAPADRDAAIATIRRWANLPPLGPQALEALKGRLAQEPSLDYVERMTRRMVRPRL